MKSEMEKLREKQQRRRRQRTLRILAVSPLIAFVFVAGLSLLTRISTVVVRNSSPYSTAEIVRQFPFSIGDSLFSVDREALAEQITVNCPYVKSASVQYRFPNDLEISLSPATASVALRTETEVLLLDGDLKVLEVVDQLPEGLLSVDGMEISSYTAGYPLDGTENIQTTVILDLLAELKKSGLDQHTTSIDLTKKYNITLEMYDDITVYLGNSDDFDQKLNLLVRILEANDVTVPAEIRVVNYLKGSYSRKEVPEESPSSDQNPPEEDTNSDNS